MNSSLFAHLHVESDSGSSLGWGTWEKKKLFLPPEDRVDLLCYPWLYMLETAFGKCAIYADQLHFEKLSLFSSS